MIKTMYLDPKDLSEKLSVSQSTIYSWVSRGKIPHYKLGALVRFDPADIEAWQAENEKRRRYLNFE